MGGMQGLRCVGNVVEAIVPDPLRGRG